MCGKYDEDVTLVITNHLIKLQEVVPNFVQLAIHNHSNDIH